MTHPSRPRPAAPPPETPPTPEAPRQGLSRGLDRLFRTSLILVPFGVLGNLALSWFATDHSVLASLDDRPRKYLYLAIVLALVPWITNALRLLIWARFISYRVSFRDMLRVTLGAELASSVIPTSSGGEVFRWGMMVQKGITQGQAASIVSLGYLEDAVFFAIAIPASIVVSEAWDLPVLKAVGSELRGQAFFVVAAILLGLVALGILWRAMLRGVLGARGARKLRRFTARARRRLRRTWHDFRGVWRMVVARGKARFALTFLITAVQWSCRYSVVTAIALFLGAEGVDPVLFFLLQWIIFTAMLFIPTPGASGGAEAAFVLVYSALLPREIIGIATAGWRMLTFYFQLALGAVLFGGLNYLDARDRRSAARRD